MITDRQFNLQCICIYAHIITFVFRDYDLCNLLYTEAYIIIVI